MKVLRVPEAFAQEIGADVGKTANMEVRDGKLIVGIAQAKTTSTPLHFGATRCWHNARKPAPRARMGIARWQPSLVTIARIDLDLSLGHEQSGHRPAIVLTPRDYNVRSGLCIMRPITSRDFIKQFDRSRTSFSVAPLRPIGWARRPAKQGAGGSKRQYGATSTSVRPKSSPLNSKASDLFFARAYAKQSPKLRLASCRPRP